MINLQFKQPIKPSTDCTVLQHTAQLTLDEAGIDPDSELSIVVGNDKLLQRLNRKYRGIDSTTDVLSFPSSDIDPDTHSLYLGDVVISLPRAQEQASAGGHSLIEELQLLTVHGTLHLLGYDHLATQDKRKMQSIQNRILSRLGVNLEVIL